MHKISAEGGRRHPRITSNTSLSNFQMEEVLEEDPSVRGTPTEEREGEDTSTLARYFSDNEVKSKHGLAQQYPPEPQQARPTTSHLSTLRPLS